MVKKGKIQKKGFFEVDSDITAAKIHLYASSAEELDGKIVKIDLTRSLRGKSIELRLKVRMKEKELIGEPIGLELAGSYIRRAFRKGADYVEDSFICDCKDVKVLVKPFMLTRNKVSRAVRRRIRVVAKDYLMGYLKTRVAKEIFTEIMTNKIQKELSLKLKKIYPLAMCEIRVFEILGSKDEVKDEQKIDEEERDVNAESKAEYLKDKDEKREKAKEDEKKDKRGKAKKELKEDDLKEKKEEDKSSKKEK